jgi:DNA-binding MarR family transcriptional regulator
MSTARSDPQNPSRWPPTGFLLSKAGRTQAVRFAQRLEPFGIRPKHFALLNFVDASAGCSQQELGDRLGLDPSGLVAAIDDLEADGWVERRRDPADRRRHALHLTRKGRTRLARARKIAMEREAELLAPLSEREVKTFHDLLLRIVTADDPKLRPVVTPRPQR